MSGPSAVNSRLPILKPPATPRSDAGQRERLVAGRHVERDQELIHACSFLRRVEAAGELRQPRDAVALHVRLQAVEQPRPDERIDEVRGADLHGGGAGDHELEHVARPSRCRPCR